MKEPTSSVLLGQLRRRERGSIARIGSYKPNEVKKVFADFHRMVDPWIKRGLTRVEIKHTPKEARRVLTEAQRQAYINRSRNQPSSKQKAEHREIPGQQALF